MADNVAITAGSGTNIATDDDGTAHHQSVKLMLGANGTFTGWAPGDATQGLMVQPRRKLVRVQDASSGLTTASTNYTAGDQVGALQSAASAFRTSVNSGTITGVILVDEGDVCPTTAGYDIYLWYSDPTLASDNAAGPAVSDADSAVLVGKIEMPAFRDEGSNRTSVWYGAVDVVSSDTALRYSYVTRGDHNFFAATDDLNITFLIVQD